MIGLPRLLSSARWWLLVNKWITGHYFTNNFGTPNQQKFQGHLQKNLEGKLEQNLEKLDHETDFAVAENSQIQSSVQNCSHVTNLPKFCFS